MSGLALLTPMLLKNSDEKVTLTFAEIEEICQQPLPPSAQYYTWWVNKVASRPHSKFWLDAGRRASLDPKERTVTFYIDRSAEPRDLASAVVDDSSPQELTEYVESSLSLERDLEEQILNHLDVLEPGLTLVSRQEASDVGRLDLLAMDKHGNSVIIELKAGEAKDSSIGQIARYMGWYGEKNGTPPRAILVASGFSLPVRWAAKAIPGLKLVTYRVQFSFDEATVQSEKP